MKPQEVTTKDWPSFLNLAEKLSEGGLGYDSTFVFRGHEDTTWPLQPSFHRTMIDLGLSKEDSLRMEDRACAEFISQAHNHISPNTLALTETKFAWWTLMQHHGAPTRLLDWTTSPYVAAYFATVGLPKKDGCIWVLNPFPLKQAMRAKYGDFTALAKKEGFADSFLSPNTPPIVEVVHRGHRSDRLIAQQGLFTICRQILGDHGELIAHALPATDLFLFGKITIPADVKPEFLSKLRKMNVSAGSLFPGLEGLAWSIREFVSIGKSVLYDATGNVLPNVTPWE